MKFPIYGLLLAGGKSQRMGQDKALLRYAAETQLERGAALLKSVCTQVAISHRSEQHYPLPSGTMAIHDQIDDVRGPLCGILSAMHAYPKAHWLVMACDLPNVDCTTLQELIQYFESAAPQLTAYKSSHDGLPEPLCALYPAGADHTLLARAKALGKACPRKLLMMEKARLLPQSDPHALDNFNTLQEFQSYQKTPSHLERSSYAH
jgi:molybdopterin-guanine dinucleotide biosynthesis protein A